MEASAVPKVIRWRVYLQSFTFLLRHIAGRQNAIADYLSRVHDTGDINTAPGALLAAVSKASPISRHGRKKVDFAVPDIALSEPMHDIPTAALDQDNDDAQTQPAADAPLIHTGDAPEQEVSALPPSPLQRSAVLAELHGGRMGHHGARDLWKTLNRLRPGHNIPYRVVQDFVASCPVCQKDRLGMADALQPIVRHLKPPHKRSVVGIDTLTVTPKDKDGNSYLFVIVNRFTKFTALYPSKDHGAVSAATALFQFCCSYGLFDSLISDPGTEFANEIVTHLTAWFGIRHVFSLVERHESNGVEGTNKQVLRHLKALVMDERVQDRWFTDSAPSGTVHIELA